MCDQGHILTFTSKDCKIIREYSGKLVATASKTPNNMNILDDIKKEKCCLGREDESWLWHRRMGHIHFGNLIKVSKHQAIGEMPEIHKPKSSSCEACQHGPLEHVHTYQCGPT